MCDVRQRLVIGYHGCDESVRDALLNDPGNIRISKEKFDWLGQGMYFWENDCVRAMEWAKEKQRRGKIEKPAVIGAVLDLGHCCDFLNAEDLHRIRSFFKILVNSVGGVEEKIPENKDAPGDKSGNKVLRMRDCYVIESMVEYLREQANLDYAVLGLTDEKVPDSVRGAFVEGDPVFPGSDIYDKTHIQISVRNPDCIIGFFIPREKQRPEALVDDYHPLMNDYTTAGAL